MSRKNFTSGDCLAPMSALLFAVPLHIRNQPAPAVPSTCLQAWEVNRTTVHSWPAMRLWRLLDYPRTPSGTSHGTGGIFDLYQRTSMQKPLASPMTRHYDKTATPISLSSTFGAPHCRGCPPLHHRHNQLTSNFHLERLRRLRPTLILPQCLRRLRPPRNSHLMGNLTGASRRFWSSLDIWFIFSRKAPVVVGQDFSLWLFLATTTVSLSVIYQLLSLGAFRYTLHNKQLAGWKLVTFCASLARPSRLFC